MWNMYIAGEYGGANDAFASLHAITRKPEYLTVARYFDNRNVKDPTVANDDILDGRHANQHIPQFIGYLRIFEQSNEQDYHTAAKNLARSYASVTRSRAHSTPSPRTGTTPRPASFTTC